MPASRNKTFFLSLLVMDACLCIYSLPMSWNFFVRHPLSLLGAFIINIILGLWKIAPLFLLYGFIFVDKFINVNSKIVLFLKVLYVLISCCLSLLIDYSIHYSKPSISEMLSQSLYLFISGLTTMIIYEKRLKLL